MKARDTYFADMLKALRGTMKGLLLTGRHYGLGHRRREPLGIQDPQYFAQHREGPVTIQYPAQKVPVPDTGRYRLHMETDDCIGCDKCARICPVDCITIETFRADGDLGRTSDGTIKRLHLPVFDIDMAKCMYCGLCTTVCPTECITMTKVYDFSEYDRDNLIYHFGAYSPEEEARIRKETEAALEAKKAAKAAPQKLAREESTATSQESNPPSQETPSAPATGEPKPRPRPMIKRTPIQPPPEDKQPE